MKTIIAVILIFIIITVFSISFYYYLKISLRDTIALIDPMDEYISNENFEAAKEIYDKIEDRWSSKEKFFKLQLEHSELDKINELMEGVKATIDNKIDDDYFICSYQLKFFLTHMIEKNKLNLETIL